MSLYVCVHAQVHLCSHLQLQCLEGAHMEVRGEHSESARSLHVDLSSGDQHRASGLQQHWLPEPSGWATLMALGCMLYTFVFFNVHHNFFTMFKIFS